MKKNAIITTMLAALCLGVTLTGCDFGSNANPDNNGQTVSSDDKTDNKTDDKTDAKTTVSDDKKGDENKNEPIISKIIEYSGALESKKKVSETQYKDGQVFNYNVYSDGELQTRTTYKYDGDKVIFSKTMDKEGDVKSTTEIEYTDGNRKETVTRYNWRGEVEATNEYNYELEYDKDGNLIKEYNVSSFNDSYEMQHTYSYTYDKKGNIVKEEYLTMQVITDSEKTPTNYFTLLVKEYEYEDDRIVAAHEHQDINDNFGEKYGIRQKDYEYKYNEDGVLETIVVYDADGNVISHLEYEYKEQ